MNLDLCCLEYNFKNRDITSKNVPVCLPSRRKMSNGIMQLTTTLPPTAPIVWKAISRIQCKDTQHLIDIFESEISHTTIATDVINQQRKPVLLSNIFQKDLFRHQSGAEFSKMAFLPIVVLVLSSKTHKPLQNRQHDVFRYLNIQTDSIGFSPLNKMGRDQESVQESETIYSHMKTSRMHLFKFSFSSKERVLENNHVHQYIKRLQNPLQGKNTEDLNNRKEFGNNSNDDDEESFVSRGEFSDDEDSYYQSSSESEFAYDEDLETESHPVYDDEKESTTSILGDIYDSDDEDYSPY